MRVHAIPFRPHETCLFLLLTFLLFTKRICSASSLGFDFHHRFSDKVRKWAESGNWVDAHWPEKNSVEYYAALVANDRVVRERRLAGTNSPVTFSEGNETLRIRPLGFLHYAEVSVGTPSVSFLVALDTGSDLFWLPCECKSCAPTSSPDYGLGPNVNFSIYSPRSSSTSQSILCNSSFCELKSQCQAEQSQCPYTVRYLSENTSTSGVLVQDVLELITDDSQKRRVETRIVIGCGQIQTGHFLDRAAPNGLMGLGLDPISVPSVLSNNGIASNSFSMCFSKDGVGRIRFGDKGSSDQAETPIKINQRLPTYFVTINAISIGRALLTGTLNAIMDTGTSFTYLRDPLYSLIGRTFTSSVNDKNVSLGNKIPFEYCYQSRNRTTRVPAIALIMQGGQEFIGITPAEVVATQGDTFYYCLGIIKSNSVDIIGQNFMTGNKLVFDKERLVLGWQPADCYGEQNSSNGTFPQAVPPGIPLSPSTTSIPVNDNTTNGIGPALSSTHSLRPYFFGLVLPILAFIL